MTKSVIMEKEREQQNKETAMNRNDKAVVILSGGMDSTTLLYDLINQGYEVYALTFDYGQRHDKELEFAKRTTEKNDIPHEIVDISDVQKLLKGSALTDDIDVPEGHYEEETMKQTVVPNRNMIMLSIATGYAVSVGAEEVFFAAHAGDHAIYPDCRPEFVMKLTEVTEIANYLPVSIRAPYLGLTKGQIAVVGKELNVPYEDTWTCYKGLDEPCKACGACQERIEAMEFAGVEDKLYQD